VETYPLNPEFTALTVVELGGQKIAIQAARILRVLRSLATRCIESGYDLLHCDRDLFVEHLALRVVI
jgi:hypothetical protein